MAETNPNEVAQRIVTLRAEIAQAIRALCDIEIHQKLDDRSYSSLDIIEAASIVEQVVTARLNGSYDEWRHDSKQEYSALFGSIEKECREAIAACFQNTKGNALRFVNSFNTVIVERLFSLFKMIGPDATKALIGPTIQDIKNTVAAVDSENLMNDADARSALDSLRRTPTKRVLTKKERLNLIRKICESRQIEAA